MAVAADPAIVSRKGEAADSAVEELEEEAERFAVLIAPLRVAPTALVERRQDLANILIASCLSGLQLHCR